ncbi:MAG: tRNA-dihydrouridine synthase [Nanoarchaeota archaeon]|nr:tRNA-dihydrouridine synthase [Nanoarchaeota archaeon]
MEMGFWKKLSAKGAVPASGWGSASGGKKPIIAMAPMANVTDAAFRRMFAKYGKPDVFWTEFVSTEALCSEKGRESALLDLIYSKDERPIVAQIFGSKPNLFYKSAEMIKQLGFDGVDLNMGCPDRNVEKQGAGAALIKNPGLAEEIIEATKEGAGGLPVSIKTRIGYNKDITEEWTAHLLESDPAAITFHARTRKEMSDVPAHWDAIARAVKARDAAKKSTLILGNGDVRSVREAARKSEETGCDGVMIGRGMFGNPWCFKGVKREEKTLEERLRAMCEHARYFEELFREKKNFAVMKKHFKAYASDFDGAKELREELMETESADEVREKVEIFLTREV